MARQVREPFINPEFEGAFHVGVEVPSSQYEPLVRRMREMGLEPQVQRTEQPHPALQEVTYTDFSDGIAPYGYGNGRIRSAWENVVRFAEAHPDDFPLHYRAGEDEEALFGDFPFAFRWFDYRSSGLVGMSILKNIIRKRALELEAVETTRPRNFGNIVVEDSSSFS